MRAFTHINGVPDLCDVHLQLLGRGGCRKRVSPELIILGPYFEFQVVGKKRNVYGYLTPNSCGFLAYLCYTRHVSKIYHFPNSNLSGGLIGSSVISRMRCSSLTVAQIDVDS